MTPYCRFLALVLLLFALPQSATAAQLPEDDGPHAVGWRDLNFNDSHYGRGRVSLRLYYPATSAGQNKPLDASTLPLPLVAFQHGYLGKPEDYDILSEHLASWGFLVVATATESGVFGKAHKLGKDARASLQWVEDESANSTSWLFGAARPGDWAAVGHSMGARSLPTLIGLEPRVRFIVSLQPGDLDATERAYYNGYSGNAVFVSGEEDGVNPLAQNLDHANEVVMAPRKVHFLIEGTGHFGPTDGEQGSHSLPWTEQNRVFRRLVGSWIRSWATNDENLLEPVLGESHLPQPFASRSTCADPILFALDSLAGANLQIGCAATSGDRVRLAWSLAQGSTTTPFGVFGLDLGQGGVFSDTALGFGGQILAFLPVQSGWSGRTLFIQGVAQSSPQQGAVSRVASISIP